MWAADDIPEAGGLRWADFRRHLFLHHPPRRRTAQRNAAGLGRYPQVNQFRGCRTVQLLITDIRRALSPAMVDLRIYQRFRAGEMLSNQELRRLLPQRQDFVATWRYLAHYAGKGTLTEQPLALSNRIARTFGLPCGCSRTLICLDVLQERGLIDLAAEPEVLRITLRQVEQKVDLDDSSILRQLRQLLQDS